MKRSLSAPSTDVGDDRIVGDRRHEHRQAGYQRERDGDADAGGEQHGPPGRRRDGPEAVSAELPHEHEQRAAAVGDVAEQQRQPEEEPDHELQPDQGGEGLGQVDRAARRRPDQHRAQGAVLALAGELAAGDGGADQRQDREEADLEDEAGEERPVQVDARVEAEAAHPPALVVLDREADQHDDAEHQAEDEADVRGRPAVELEQLPAQQARQDHRRDGSRSRSAAEPPRPGRC